jgi:hypothetical protein
MSYSLDVKVITWERLEFDSKEEMEDVKSKLESMGLNSSSDVTNYLNRSFNKIDNATDKENIIDLIQNVFVNWGEFNISDVESADAPIYNELGNHIELIESFNNNSVTIFKYENDIEVDEFELDYEDLSMDLLEEILLIAEQYDVEQQKFFDSCLNKNF